MSTDARGGEGQSWWALIVLCTSMLIVVLSATAVNVALPSIRADLQFTGTSLIWVVNAYLLTFGGFLLLGGRLGDCYGQRRLLRIGIALFTVGSLACGLANTRGLLIGARALQGLGGAVISSVTLSLIMNMFADGAARAKAIGVYGFVAAGSGSLGLLLGGALTSALSWHWIFLVNVPIGAAIYVLCFSLLPNFQAKQADRHIDVWGAITLTTSLVLAIYAIVNGNETGRSSAETLGLLACAALLLGVFLIIESRVATPLMPLRVFRLWNLTVSNVVRVLWAAAVSGWFFLSTLYMQLVLGYEPLQVGFAFLPAYAVTAMFLFGLSARLVARFGIRKTLGCGLLLLASGLALFARAPVAGNFVTDVLPGMTLVGLGMGMAFNPLLLVSMSDVAPSEAGLASGILNTAAVMGSALGIAILVSLSAARTSDLLASGASVPVALTSGYRLAFLTAALFTGTAFLATVFLRAQTRSPAPEHMEGRVTLLASAERTPGN